VLRAGARMAEAGEFTLRAFVNGRLDLAQAEAVLDIIRAQTRPALDAALGQLGGRLSDEVRAARAILLAALAHIEASLDFPEDDVPAPNVQPQLAQAAAILARLLDSARAGIIYRQGLRCAIVGRPNVGKSSLLNALLGTERAIVTPIAGTTRDTVEETAAIAGIPIVLVDTAGINAATNDPVELIGIERSRRAYASADLVLLVLDASQPLTEADGEIIAALYETQERLIIALNKSDLSLQLDEDKLQDMLPNAAIVHTVAISGHPAALEQAIVKAALGGVQPLAANAPLVTSVRHRDALARAADRVAAAQSAAGSVPPDLLAGDIRAALNALGEITGETVGEDLLDQIFSKFCIGKLG
jgi:tRNA modification GTPase